MIMHSNMTMVERVIINVTVESCMEILSRNGYGNSIIGRYGGCFEEDIRRLMLIERIISRDFDAPAKFAPTLKVRKGNARYRRG